MVLFLPAHHCGSSARNCVELYHLFNAVLLYAHLQESNTSPVFPVMDSHLLSKLCDATLYTVRQGYTPKVFVDRLHATNKVMGLKNLAIIYNGIKAGEFSKYTYGYTTINGNEKPNILRKFSTS